MTSYRHGFAAQVMLPLLLCGALVAAAEEETEVVEKNEQSRTWTDPQGRTLSGRLLAYDRIRATVKLDDQRVVFLRPNKLSEPDRDYLKEWRSTNPKAPWIDPANIPPWPSFTGSGKVKAQVVSADAEKGRFVYQSPRFEMIADVKLPIAPISEMATAFEATRQTLLTLPLGLAARPKINYQYPPGYRGPKMSDLLIPESDRLRVELFITPQKYALSGAPAGTGGYYSRWRRSTMISLENFGIREEDGRIALDYHDQLFIIRHEVSHHVLHAWLPLLPSWLNEGLCEYIAALPYKDGQYNFSDTDDAFLRYLNKWRYDEDPRKIPMRSPGEMFTMTGEQWQATMSIGSPISNYNSAALLTWYFIHQDGDGKAAHMAAFFDALLNDPRQGKKAFTTHLLRGRPPEKIAEEIRAAWKQKGIDIVVE